jgi:hypothetical protein
VKGARTATTLEKVRLFERYLELAHGSADATLDTVLDKLLARKRAELTQHRDEMQAELAAFESQYGMSSVEFFDKFQQGALGDAVDFLDWSATWQMYTDVLKYLEALSAELVTA